MAGLENLREYTSLTINENEQLRTLSGLSANVSQSAYLSPTVVRILNNPQLHDLTGLHRIEGITGEHLLAVAYNTHTILSMKAY